MIIKIRTYPLSPKLAALNGAFLCLNIFLSFGVFILLAVILDGVGTNSGKMKLFLMVPPFIFFIIMYKLINRQTDKKYDVILQNHKETCEKLINQNLEIIKDKKLIYPVNITFTRLNKFSGRFVKVKYIVNGKEYKLGNGETINFTTNSALNTIQIKSFAFKDLKYFTVDEGERMTIEYSLNTLQNVERK